MLSVGPMKTAPAKKKLNVRDQRREDSRQAVLVAAADLFSRHGYNGVALDDIAAASGVRKNNLIYHFTSKEQLWKEAVDWIFARTDAFFSETRSPPTKDPWEGFEDYARSYFEVCRRFPPYMLIPLIEGVNQSWRSDYLAEHHLRRNIQNFDQYVHELVAAGVLPPIQSIYLQNIFTGGAQLFLALGPLWQKAIDVDTHEPEFVENYVNALLQLIKGAPPKNR